tara:strand:+ start:531 stop:1724 length:1194 start_codon:yes stop_codon:yes gene_type:complete
MAQESLEAALEQHLNTLGKQLEGTLEEWRNSETDKRNELQTQIKGLEDAISGITKGLKEERRGHLPGVEVAKGEEKGAFKMSRAIRAIARRSFDDAPYEKEVFDNMKAKAMSQGTDSAGGFIVPEEAISSIIEKLKAKVVAYELGAMDLAATGVPLVIPRLLTSATGSWVGENASIGDSSQVFEQVSMSPKTVAGRVILSNLLLETSQPTADRIIEEDLASQLGLALDLGVLSGTGSASQPTGITEAASVGTFTIDNMATTAPTYAEMLGAVDDLANANALQGSLGWALHPTAASLLRQMLGLSNFDMNRRDLAMGVDSTILGYKYATTTQLATVADGSKSIIFGNWADLMIARWGGMRLLASDQSDDAFSKDQTHIRATMRVDVGIRHPESFTVSA